MELVVVTHAGAGTHRGARVTALRWAQMLAELGHRPVLRPSWTGEPCTALVVVDAEENIADIERFGLERPADPLIVGLSDPDPATIARLSTACDSADRLILFHDFQGAAREQVPPEHQQKVHVIPVSAAAPRDAGVDDSAFHVCVLAHLRREKDPLQAAYAVRRLPHWSRIQVVHAGAALSRDVTEEARDEEGRNPRYRWVGDMPPPLARQLLARSRLLVSTGRREGRLNTLAEGVAAGVPVIAASLPGARSLLGDSYPGLVPARDTIALTERLLQAEEDPAFYESLRTGVADRRFVIDPAAESDAWQRLLEQLSER